MQLLPLVYEELKRLAESYLRRERGLPMCRTELVHELYLKLPSKVPEFENRAHFYGIAARLMRQILVDLARERKRQKRQHDPATIAFMTHRATPAMVDVLLLDQCVTRLREVDPRKAQIVEMRSFGGLSIEEIADGLGVSPATVKRDWSVARLWMRRELDRSPGEPGDE